MSKKADTKLSNQFQIAETDTFLKNISDKKYSFLYTKIKSYVYPILKNNPFFGANIKKLKVIFLAIIDIELVNTGFFIL